MVRRRRRWLLGSRTGSRDVFRVELLRIRCRDLRQRLIERKPNRETCTTHRADFGLSPRTSMRFCDHSRSASAIVICLTRESLRSRSSFTASASSRVRNVRFRSTLPSDTFSRNLVAPS